MASDHQTTSSSRPECNSWKRKEPNAKKIIFLASCSLLLLPCSAADAQQHAKVHRIGYLVPSSRSALAARTDAFRQSLRELGYIEGKNILIEYRYADGKPDLLNQLA